MNGKSRRISTAEAKLPSQAGKDVRIREEEGRARGGSGGVKRRRREESKGVEVVPISNSNSHINSGSINKPSSMRRGRRRKMIGFHLQFLHGRPQDQVLKQGRMGDWVMG
jgi:hypothetical protein